METTRIRDWPRASIVTTPPAAQSIDELIARVLPFVTFTVPTDVNPYDSLREVLGLDSIHVFELIVALESIAGCVAPAIEVPILDSFADAFEYYWKCVPRADD